MGGRGSSSGKIGSSGSSGKAGGGASKARKAKAVLTLDEKIQKNAEELRKVSDQLYRLPIDADDKEFQRINNRLNELQKQQEELTKGKKKQERQSKKKKQEKKPTKVEQENIDTIRQQINELKSENVSLLEQDYGGKKKWGRQLDARIKKAKQNNAKIEKLEAKLQKLKK